MWRFTRSQVVACLVAGACTALVQADRRGVAPFTLEAQQRGLLFTMMNFPQQTGFYGFGCGFADLDSDGDSDVVIVGGAAWIVGIFENQNGTFVNRSATSGLPPLGALSGLASADYDGDGDMDLFLSRVLEAPVLLRNNGNFTFSDVTELAGIDVYSARIGKGACWGDYNGDGWVDLYVCNYLHISGGEHASENYLYRNNGDGTFTDVATEVGVNSDSPSFEAVWTDFDRDGDLDLYLSNDRGTTPGFPGNELFRNDGGVFTEIGAKSGTNVKLNSMGLACGDFNADGFVDFYVTNTSGPQLAPEHAFPLLLSQGATQTFQSEELKWGVAHPSVYWAWGAFFFDWNNDRHLDLYVINQEGPNSLFHNSGAPPAVDIALEAAIGGPTPVARSKFCAAYADIDNDGDLDILLNPLAGPVDLYINHEGSKRGAVRLRVIGDGPNTGAIGANADLTADGVTQFQEIYAGGQSYLGQNEQILHFGVGSAKQATSAIVRWPSRGPTRTLSNIPVHQQWIVWPPAVLGDADHDGDFDFADRLAIVAAFGPVAPGQERLDLDGTFVIDSADMLLFKGKFEAAGLRWADLTNDGLVNGADLAMLLGGWGSSGALIDLDGSGRVGGGDLALLLGDWG